MNTCRSQKIWCCINLIIIIIWISSLWKYWWLFEKKNFFIHSISSLHIIHPSLPPSSIAIFTLTNTKWTLHNIHILYIKIIFFIHHNRNTISTSYHSYNNIVAQIERLMCICRLYTYMHKTIQYISHIFDTHKILHGIDVGSHRLTIRMKNW